MSSFRPELPSSDITQKGLADQAAKDQQAKRHQRVLDEAWDRFRTGIGAERSQAVGVLLGRIAVDTPTSFSSKCGHWTYAMQAYLGDTVIERRTEVQVITRNVPPELDDEVTQAAIYLNRPPTNKSPAQLLGVSSEKTGGFFSERRIPKMPLAHAFGRHILAYAGMLAAESSDVPLTPGSAPIPQGIALIQPEWHKIKELPEPYVSRSLCDLRKDAARSLLPPDSPSYQRERPDVSTLTDEQFGDYLFGQFVGGSEADEAADCFSLLDKVNVTLAQSSATLPQF